MKLLILSALLLPFVVSAQYDLLNIPIQKNTITSPIGLAGGLNNPQFSTADFNNDGILDLLVYDRSGQIALTFINNGTPNQVDYLYASEYQSNFPQNTERYMLLRDYDGDGIDDLFYFDRTIANPTGGMSIAKGSYDGNNKLQFTTVVPLVTYSNALGQNIPISILSSDIPEISDIDNDGDLDILAFSADPLFVRNISWYKNMSVENSLGLANPSFILEHQCWGMITETNTNNTVFLSPHIDSCPDNSFWLPPGAASPRHAGSTLAAIDFNGDGIKDIVMGDASINTLNLMTNSIVNDSFLIVNQDSAFPQYNTSTDILSFPAAFFVDVNNDGKTDMLASPNEVQISEAVTDSVVWYYQNTQSNSNIQLALQEKSFLTDQMIDGGQDAYPIFFDYNGDGLLDILIGHLGALQADKSYKTGITLLENIGTASNPIFNFITADYANLSSLNILGMHPTAGDIDGDNDLDLVLGTVDGKLVFVENTAAPNTLATWATPVIDWQGIDIGDFSAPQWIDLDRDGDLDLAIGEAIGNINYFENTGNATSPTYNNTPTTIGLSGLDINVLNPSSKRSSPCFIEVDNQYELFIGHQNGFPIHLKNVESNILGSYDTISLGITSLWTGKNTDLDAADINNDGRLDFVIGNSRGGLGFFSVDTLTVNTTKIPNHNNLVIDNIYPNPTNDQLSVVFNRVNDQALVFEVYNTLGQQVLTKLSNSYQQQHSIPVGQLPSGIYYLHLKDNPKQSRKFVVD